MPRAAPLDFFIEDRDGRESGRPEEVDVVRELTAQVTKHASAFVSIKPPT